MSKLTKVADLSFKQAVEAIKDSREVMYKHGVWNSYALEKTEDVIKHINNSAWGADVYRNEEGTLYVCTPANADMW